VIVQYEDEDRDLVWRVPNLIVDRYIAYRNEVHQAEARHSVQFLRAQLDSVSAQLNTSEEALRSYRQRYLVISPGTEASSQVSQMAQLQAQRRDIDTEREVLARLLAEADAKTARAAPEDPSPYRELLAFPTLMRSGAASDLLQGLARKDEERSALLARRTPSDPDVQALTERIQSLQGQIRGVVASYLESLSRQIAELDTSQARFGQQLSRIPTTELGLARLERKPKVLQEIYTLLQTRLQEAEIAQASEDPSVRRVDAAIPTYMPIRPRRTRNLFGGLSLGLMLGAAAGLLREARDKSVRSRADVLHATGMPVLGLIPQIPSRGKRGVMLGEWSNTAAKEEMLPRFRDIARRTYTFLGELPPGAGAADAGTSDNGLPKPGDLPRMVAFPEDRRPALEAYSALQTNLELVAANPATRVLLLTSPLAGEGKTTCAGNLALALAERGRRVLLIDVDLRQGKVHAFFDSPRRPGLAEVLTGALSLDDVCHSIELGTGRRLDYVTTGTPPTAPLALLESRELAELLAGLRERYETILLDSPPVNYVTDALLLSAHADGVIVVARSGQTEGPDLSFAMEQLRRAGAPVLGVALNAINFRGDAAYDRVYRYFVESPYGPAAPEG
jgi:succinoglycan biosynthesis transport protein ExoP